MPRLRWTIFAHGDVGNEILRQVGGRGPDEVAAIITSGPADPTWETVFKNADFYNWAQIVEPEGVKKLANKSEIVLLAWWPYILSAPMLELGQKVMLNLHPSLLPHGRGKDPNFWCLVENRPMGVTIHHVGRNVDAGEIAFQKVIETSWTDTGETIYHKSQRALIELFEEVYPKISKLDIPKIEQDLTAGSFHRRDELDAASLIDLDRSYTGRQLLNLLRARTFPGHPSCWFQADGREYEASINIRVRT